MYSEYKIGKGTSALAQVMLNDFHNVKLVLSIPTAIITILLNTL